jgi:hypothetical protein
MSPRPGTSVLKTGSRWRQAQPHLNHQAKTTLETPHATAGPDVEVVNTSWLEFLGAPDVVDVVRIASIYNDVALLHLGAEAVQRFIDRRRGHHQPSRSWRL